MDYILTLNKITRSDSDTVGFRAVDLAEAHNNKISVPVSFVIKNSMFENFIDSNNLKPHIKQIYSNIRFDDENALNDAYSKVKELIHSADFPESMQEELLEAYETLAIDMDHIDITKLVTTIEKPFLTLIGSVNYIEPHENSENIIQNIKGRAILFKCIKDCWASLYSPSAVIYRKKADIDTKPKIGIVAQRMVESEISIQTYSQNDEILVKTFFGYQDLNNLVGKDEHLFNKETLELKGNRVILQEHQIARDMQSGSLAKKQVYDEGNKQKLNDRDCEEAARQNKKIENLIGKPIKTYMSYIKEKISVLYISRIISEKEDEKIEINDEVINETTESTSNEVPSAPNQIPSFEDDPELKDIPMPTEDELEDYEHVTHPDNNVDEEDSIKIVESDFEDDISFLEEIEKFEKEEEKEEKEEESSDNNSAQINSEFEPDITESTGNIIDEKNNETNQVEETNWDEASNQESEIPKIPTSDSHLNEEVLESSNENKDFDTVPMSDLFDEPKEESFIPKQNENNPEESSKNYQYLDEENPSFEGKEVSESNFENTIEQVEEITSNKSSIIKENAPFSDLTSASENVSDNFDSPSTNMNDNFEDDIQKPISSEPIAEPILENNSAEPQEESVPKLEEEIDDNDDFIFSQFEEPATTKQEEIIPPSVQEEPASVTPTPTTPQETKKNSLLDEAFNQVRDIIIKSDEAIKEAIFKKYEAVIGTSPSSLDEAIEKLKISVRIPFIPEIKKVHGLRVKAEHGQEVEAEEAGIALRTAKNFLTIFS